MRKTIDTIGVYLYAYECDVKTNESQYTDLKLLLEYNGKYKAFGRNAHGGFNGMFGYGTEEDYHRRNFDKGYEYDFDNDGKLELYLPVITGFGSEFLETDILIFDFNDYTKEYEAYCLSEKVLKMLENKAVKTFFDEYYGTYTLDENEKFDFGNGYKAAPFNHVECQISEDNNIVITVVVACSDKEGAGTSWIGEVAFLARYQGKGKFAVKAYKYTEWDDCVRE